MGLDDFAPATAAENMDEDLFDFPAMEIPEPPKAEVEEAPSPEPESAPAPQAEEAATAPAKAPKPAVGCTGLDPELDEDLFGFPPMDLSSIGITAGQDPADALEASIDKAAQGVNELLEDDLGDIVQAAHEEQAAAAQPAPVPAPTPVPAQAEPVAANTTQVQAPVLAPALAPQMAYSTVAVAGTSPKALWVLTAATILFMVGVLGIAWRATSNFQQQLHAVRSDVQASTKELQESTTGTIRELAQLERELLRNQVAAAKATQEVRMPTRGLELSAPHEVVLSVASDAIQMGRFSEARKMLFNLLAKADNHPVDTRENMEREASFLIAQSHKSEAETLAGGDK